MFAHTQEKILQRRRHLRARVGDHGLSQAEIIKEGQEYSPCLDGNKCANLPLGLEKVLIFVVLQLLLVFMTASPSALAGLKLAM